MELLSLKDHLTGAWNRRFLADRFPGIARQCQTSDQTLHVAVLDIDDFKGINDRHGHHIGDEILIRLASIFTRHLGSDGYLVRLGGDEFQIIYCGDGLDKLIDHAVADLQEEPISSDLAASGRVTLSAGIVSAPPGTKAELETLYKAADRALYDVKHDRSSNVRQFSFLTRTGSWQL